MSIALPIAGARRGACPSLDAPMQTGDGLLARLRVVGGRLTPAALGKLAGIAGSFGNGAIEITARGNLQVRGLRAAGAVPFARAVEAVVGIERGLVVETPPLAGSDPYEILDPRPLARAIRDGSAAMAPRLGPKVTVIVDGNGQLNLADLKADIRLVATTGGWTISAGKHYFGATSQPAQAALAVLSLLANHGPEARAADLPHIQLLAALGHLCIDAPAPIQPGTTPIGRLDLNTVGVVGLGLPFGASPFRAMVELAAMAQRHGVTEFRLAPQHAILAIGVGSGMVDALADSDFIIDPDDPRRRISACIGSTGCSSGHIPARQVAARLAGIMDHHADLHVAGCAKGCAHPRRAALTLVGRPDGYGLVIEGTAGDTPVTVLRADQIEIALGAAAQG
jgi:precorrin-3B synthase